MKEIDRGYLLEPLHCISPELVFQHSTRHGVCLVLHHRGKNVKEALIKIIREEPEADGAESQGSGSRDS